jgi:hypothetical protein
MYYAIVHIDNEIVAFSADSLNEFAESGVVSDSYAIVYSTVEQLKQFYDQKRLREIVLFYEPKSPFGNTAEQLHWYVTNTATHVEVTNMSGMDPYSLPPVEKKKRLTMRSKKPLSKGKDYASRLGTHRHNGILVLQKCNDTTEALIELMKYGFTRHVSAGILRFAINQGYVVVGE